MKIDFIAAILLWFGNGILIVKKSYWAFVIFLVANLIWTVYWYSKKEWVAMALVMSFIIQNIWGIIKWRRECKRKEATVVEYGEPEQIKTTWPHWKKYIDSIGDFR